MSVMLRMNVTSYPVDSLPVAVGRGGQNEVPLERDEFADSARSGVVEPEGHAAILGASRASLGGGGNVKKHDLCDE